MEIPLSFRELKDGRLSYGIPAWYRAMMAFVTALVAAALFSLGQAPGAAGWIVLALVAAAALYEDRWTFDAAGGAVVHRAGLVFLARRTSLALGDLSSFSIRPYVRGTIPGSADEAAENEAALSGGRADDSGRRRASYKKPFLCIVALAEDGSSYFVDAAPARKRDAIRQAAARMAAYCGKPLAEGAAAGS